MANQQSSGASLRELQALFQGGSTSGLTDRQLLERFADRRDEAAFAGLIDRHGSMVWGVCRRMLHDPADAGDAFQATFLVLVRRAGSVRVDESLGPWLYGVSMRVARRARVVAIRHRERERTNTALPETPAVQPDSSDDRRPVIDEELTRLPARYRSALILCYLEGLTHEEAARQLACPVGTVRSRLARGRDLLRSRLERRGLTPGGLAFGSALLRESGRPESLLTSTAQAAARLAAGDPLAGTVPARVEALVAGVSRTMVLTKTGLIMAYLAVPLIGIATLASSGAGPLPAADHERAVATPPTKPTRPPAVAVAALLESNQGQGRANAPSDAEAGDAFQAFPAVVVKTVPPVGATDVDPGLKEVEVTFSKPMMDGSWSWAQIGKETFPELTGKPRYATDKRTCLLPVKLEPSKTYAIWCNSPKFGNFKDAGGHSAVPSLLLFRTKAP